MTSFLRKVVSRGHKAPDESEFDLTGETAALIKRQKSARNSLNFSKLGANNKSFRNSWSSSRSLQQEEVSMNQGKSYRAPDPRQGKAGWGSKKGLQTVNMKHRNRGHRQSQNLTDSKSHSKSFSSLKVANPAFESGSKGSMRGIMNTLGRTKKKRREILESVEDLKAREAEEQERRKNRKSKGKSKSSQKQKEQQTLQRSRTENYTQDENTMPKPELLKQDSCESLMSVTSSPNSGRFKPNLLSQTIAHHSQSSSFQSHSNDPALNLSMQLKNNASKKATYSGSYSSVHLGGRRKSDSSESVLSESLKKTKEKNKTLPRKVQELKKKYLSQLYAQGEKTKNNATKETQLDKYRNNVGGKGVPNEDGFDGIGEDDFEFKKAMVEKFHGLSGSFGSFGLMAQEVGQYGRRRNSSFNGEDPMVLLLGTAKAGKSTIYKQMLSLAGYPPNYARAYIPTKAAVEKDLTIEDSAIQVVDVGGAKQDIVNWRFYLQKAEVIIYVVALDEYDKVVKTEVKNEKGEKEEKKSTLLLDALEVFDSIVNNVALLNSKFVLIFNKADRFKKKFCEKKVPFSAPGVYENAPTGQDYEEGVRFIQDMFLEKAAMTDHDIQVDVTCAIDSEACTEVLMKITANLAGSKEVTKWKNLL